MPTVRLTMGQALVRYLCNQYTIIDGKQERGTGTACRQPDGSWRVANS